VASYASYKKVLADSIVSGAVTETNMASGAGLQYGVAWVYSTRGFVCQQCSNAGGCVCQACGRCCLWTVPTDVTRVTFEIWSGGGGGAGHTCCNCCSFSIGGQGGNYAIKTITTTPGCQYTVCAGGSWPCSKSHTCSANMGCRSYVNGYNLSNFCATGGCGGFMCNGDAWGGGNLRHFSSGCANCNICGIFGADFGVMGTSGGKLGQTMCRCNGVSSFSGSAPFVGMYHTTMATEAWCSCGCYVNWPAGGGSSGSSSYCGNNAKCCAGGSGQGGSGMVKITYY
jgi:hypothetical protein